MTSKEILKSSQIKEFLAQTRQEEAPVIASYVTEGKWKLLELRVCGFSDDFIAFYAQTSCENLKNEQPLGICIHLGYHKYLFDTSVQAVEIQGQVCKVLLDFPEKAERVERRMYHRHQVPANMNVKVMFWHRGYLENCNQNPEESYWQGKLLNLSAGGAQIEIDPEHQSCFQVGQLLGIQFTPMSYQKPLLLESHVRYLKDQTENGRFRIGIEFLGLESTDIGRESLNRILEVLNEYEELNAQEKNLQTNTQS